MNAKSFTGGLREMHWHPNADEWTYFLKGTAWVTVFNTGPAAMTADFHRAISQKPAGHRAGLIAGLRLRGHPFLNPLARLPLIRITNTY
jgi:uncharacterized cupin superfamily protein